MNFRKILTLAIATSISLAGAFLTPSAEAAGCGPSGGCDVTITATSTGFTFSSLASGTMSGREDISIYFVNNSGSTINSLAVAGAKNNGSFYNDGDGPLGGSGYSSYNPLNPSNSYAVGGKVVAGTPAYTMSKSNSSLNSGVVTFVGGLATGSSTYFALESYQGDPGFSYVAAVGHDTGDKVKIWSPYSYMTTKNATNDSTAVSEVEKLKTGVTNSDGSEVKFSSEAITAAPNSAGAPEIDGSLAPKVGFLLGCLFLMFGRKKSVVSKQAVVA